MFGTPRCIALLLVAFIHTAVTERRFVMEGVGRKVILLCYSSSVGSCSGAEWTHQTRSSSRVVARATRTEAAEAGRLYIDSNCALHIDDITAADVGRYRCSKNWWDENDLSLITGE